MVQKLRPVKPKYATNLSAPVSDASCGFHAGYSLRGRNPRLVLRAGAGGSLLGSSDSSIEADSWADSGYIVHRIGGPTITFCGSAFDVPWSDLDNAKTKTGASSTNLYFDSGLVVVLKCLPPREFVEGVLSSLLHQCGVCSDLRL